MTPADIAATLKAERLRQHLTQEQVGQRIGRPQVAISYWEAGKRQPDLDDLTAWAAALGMTITTQRPRPHVVTDPAVRFGRPQVKGISVEILGERHWAGDDIDEIVGDYDHLTRGDVLVAYWWLGLYGGKPWPRRWGRWAETAGQALWHADTVDYDAVPGPPTPDGDG